MIDWCSLHDDESESDESSSNNYQCETTDDIDLLKDSSDEKLLQESSADYAALLNQASMSSHSNHKNGKFNLSEKRMNQIAGFNSATTKAAASPKT